MVLSRATLTMTVDMRLKSHPNGPIMLTHVDELLELKLLLPVLTTYACRTRDLRPNLPNARRTQ